MRVSYLVISVIIYSVSLVAGTSLHEQYEAMTDKRKKAVEDYLSMPFADFVRIPYSRKKSLPYQIALSERLEFYDIKWLSEDCVDLARQLWKFQSEEPNTSFSLSLVSTLRLLMKINNIEQEKVDEIFRITSLWVREKSNKASVRKVIQVKGEEMKKYRRIKDQINNRRRKEARKNGQCLPLLHYMKLPNPRQASPDELLAEALKCKKHYTSSKTYHAALLYLFRSLHFTKDQVFYQCRDQRNFTDPSWTKSKTNEASALTHAEGATAHPEEHDEEPIMNGADRLDVDNSHDWSEFGLDDLEIGDIDASYYYPSESILQEPQSSHYACYEPLVYEGESSNSQPATVEEASHSGAVETIWPDLYSPR